jgi:glutathione synthase/RimK-type ligase-like ATP-grasp enzyme
VQALGLCFGAIDLILTPDGEYVFLEVNLNGQWAYIEDLLGLPISAAIAEMLICGEA